MKIFLTMLMGAALLAMRASAQTFNVLHTFGGPVNPTGLNPQAPPIQGPDGTLYGTASQGGNTGNYYGGTVFKVQPDGSGFAVLKIFTNAMDGANPQAALVLGGNTLYGTTESGGANDSGAVFKVNTDGTGFAVLHSFTAGTNDGTSPQTALVLGGGTLYGTTCYGGGAGNGTVFQVNTDGTGFAVLKSFSAFTTMSSYENSDGANPNAGLALGNGVLYGAAGGGGAFGDGTIFKLNVNGTGFTVLKTFPAESNNGGTNTDGAAPMGTLLLNNGTLYGTAFGGGPADSGTIFKLNTDGTGFTLLAGFPDADFDPDLDTFTNSTGFGPMAGLVLSGGMLYGTTGLGGDTGYGAVFAVGTNGSGFTPLYSFPDGSSYHSYSPQPGLSVVSNSLYGATCYGGAGLGNTGDGTLFTLNTSGSGFATIYVFSNPLDGINSSGYGNLVLSGGALYGVTESGGSPADGSNPGYGTVYKINTDGTGYTILYNFNNSPDGAYPYSSLTLAGSTLYGTTGYGGASSNGTVFKINLDGTGYSVLYSFTNAPDGSFPYGIPLVTNGVIYGATQIGGASGAGTIYGIHTDGTGYSVLKNFSQPDPDSQINPDGAYPVGGLVLNGGTLFGTASFGGAGGSGAVFKINADGTAFAVLHNFSTMDPTTQINTDGASPQTGLILSGGALFGGTSYGGVNGYGTVFSINTDGTGFASLYSFSAPDPVTSTNLDGTYPFGTLWLSGGKLFGTCLEGGNSALGTIYAINTDGSGFNTLYSFTGGNNGGTPYAGLVMNGNVLYGDDNQYEGVGTVFALVLPPPLQITTVGNAPLVYWQDDGHTHPLFTTTNLLSGGWTSAPALNYTNIIGTNRCLGLQLASPLNPTSAFFRLK